VKLRPDPGIIVEGAQANGNLRTIRPVAAEQARAASDAKSLHRPLALPVNADQLLSQEQVELFLQDTRLRADRGARMLPATVAMTMTRPNEWRLDFETHTAAKTTASNHPGHKDKFSLLSRRGQS
jgi:hypothetical protein